MVLACGAELLLWCELFQVTPNLYGTLVANTAAGIAGGTGVMPGGNLRPVHFISKCIAG
jgi:isocitrate/isopropylmalate dehydrogenase